MFPFMLHRFLLRNFTDWLVLAVCLYIRGPNQCIVCVLPKVWWQVCVGTRLRHCVTWRQGGPQAKPNRTRSVPRTVIPTLASPFISMKNPNQILVHCLKSFSIFPSPAGMSLTKLSLGGNNFYMTSLFPPRQSLVSDIPAGDGNIEKLFYGVCCCKLQ